MVKLRERTRQLIERGGRAAKAGLIELPDDDRSVLFSEMLEVAATLRGESANKHSCRGRGAVGWASSSVVKQATYRRRAAA